jgi:lysozyme
MKADKSTYDFIRSPLIEGEKLKAYKCTAGKWTIGPGLCFYANGKAVKQGDVITQAQSENEFYARAVEFEKDVNSCLDRELTRKEWNVLFSIAWNYGTGWFQKKRLIVAQFNENPKDFAEIERILKLMDNRNRRMNELNYLKSI